MGEEADYALERMWDGDPYDGDYEDDEPGESHQKVCRHCKVGFLHWANVGTEVKPIWRLHDDENHIHKCVAKPLVEFKQEYHAELPPSYKKGDKCEYQIRPDEWIPCEVLGEYDNEPKRYLCLYVGTMGIQKKGIVNPWDLRPAREWDHLDFFRASGDCVCGKCGNLIVNTLWTGRYSMGINGCTGFVMGVWSSYECL